MPLTAFSPGAATLVAPGALPASGLLSCPLPPTAFGPGLNVRTNRRGDFAEFGRRVYGASGFAERGARSCAGKPQLGSACTITTFEGRRGNAASVRRQPYTRRPNSVKSASRLVGAGAGRPPGCVVCGRAADKGRKALSGVASAAPHGISARARRARCLAASDAAHRLPARTRRARCIARAPCIRCRFAPAPVASPSPHGLPVRARCSRSAGCWAGPSAVGAAAFPRVRQWEYNGGRNMCLRHRRFAGAARTYI